MLKNHLIIALRNLFKQKGLAFINIFGLSIGLACFSLFLLYAVNEFSFDRFHEKNDRLYQIYRWTKAMNGNGNRGDAHLPIPLGPALKADFPDVENYVRMRMAWRPNFVRANNQVHRIGLSYADPQIFDVFTFPLKYGDPATALNDINNLVLTEQIALQLFGEANPIGRTLEIRLDDQFQVFTISAVAENLPPNSSITFDLLTSFEKWTASSYGQRRVDNWGHSGYLTFVELREGSNLANDADRLLQFRRKYYPDEEADLRERGFWKEEGAPVEYRMQAITAIHTNPDVLGGTVDAIDPKNIWILLAIAAGILLIACINFTTLAVGRSAGRAKEIGVRKIVGSNRRGLIRQFLTEALFLSMLSVGIGLAIGQLLMPYFNELAGRELSFSLSLYPEMVWLLLGLTLVVALLSGSYPALVLSGFKPIDVLKNKIKLGGANHFTRVLVTLQFVLSVGLIASTIVILMQLDFMKSKYPGFNKENIVVVNADETDGEQIYPRFRQMALQNPKIKGMAASDIGLGAGTGWSRAGFDYKGERKEVYEYYIDENYLEVLDIQLLTGRNFHPQRQDGANLSVLINESMMENFGWTPETALDQELVGYTEEGPFPKVVGVVKDIHYSSFREAVEPQMFHHFDGYAPEKFFIRLDEGDPGPVLTALNDIWKGIVPDLPFKYSFLDEDLNRFYRSESRFSRIVGWAGGLSIFLACLGLFGLAALAVVNRTKEIGIRKVLGASLTAIVNLLSVDFLKLVGISLIMAIPLAWYFMNRWLENFAYRIELKWWVFALAGVVALMVAFLTVGTQSLRAALANPVESLRDE